jgi:hypothetical protein
MNGIYLDNFFMFYHVVNIFMWSQYKAQWKDNASTSIPTVGFHCIVVMVYTFITNNHVN